MSTCLGNPSGQQNNTFFRESPQVGNGNGTIDFFLKIIIIIGRVKDKLFRQLVVLVCVEFNGR